MNWRGHDDVMQIRSIRGSGEPAWVIALPSAGKRLGPDPSPVRERNEGHFYRLALSLRIFSQRDQSLIEFSPRQNLSKFNRGLLLKNQNCRTSLPRTQAANRAAKAAAEMVPKNGVRGRALPLTDDGPSLSAADDG